jgi:hypothetical protein
MFFISHRANYEIPNKEVENTPHQISLMLEMDWNIEIDVWYDGEQWYLGHDEPRYEIELEFLKNNKLWCHAKNLQALEFMLKNNIHCFWHEQDDYTITSKGYIWTYPGKPVCKKSVIVCKTLEDTMKYCKMDIAGVCSDYFGVFV